MIDIKYICYVTRSFFQYMYMFDPLLKGLPLLY